MRNLSGNRPSRREEVGGRKKERGGKGERREEGGGREGTVVDLR